MGHRWPTEIRSISWIGEVSMRRGYMRGRAFIAKHMIPIVINFHIVMYMQIQQVFDDALCMMYYRILCVYGLYMDTYSFDIYMILFYEPQCVWMMVSYACGV